MNIAMWFVCLAIALPIARFIGLIVLTRFGTIYLRGPFGYSALRGPEKAAHAGEKRRLSLPDGHAF